MNLDAAMWTRIILMATGLVVGYAVFVPPSDARIPVALGRPMQPLLIEE